MPGRSDEISGYRRAGVDIDAGADFVQRIAPIAASTAQPGARPDFGGFGGLFDLAAAGFRDPLLVAATDGVGTKLMVAAAADRHCGIGIDLVAMCVNDLVVHGARPLFFLDYFAAGALASEIAVEVVTGIGEGCRQAGCALIGGETAEMPGLYDRGHYDLAGFAVGAVERGAMLPRRDIHPGDIILGLASDGVHANGFSLVRQLVAERGLSWDAPAPFAPGATLAEAFLIPTRIYVPAVLAALATGIKGLAHITGGGLIENVPRILPPTLGARLHRSAWPTPPVFDWLADGSAVAPDEMLRVFNCGIGMTAITAPEAADAAAAALTAAGERAWRIGVVTDRPGIIISDTPPR